MEIDITALSEFLSPFLPFLQKAGEKFADESGKKFGAEAWEKAKSIWVKLRPKVESKSTAKEAVEDLVATPNNEDVKAAFRWQLKKLLENDEALAKELALLMKESQTTPNIIAGGNVMKWSGDQKVEQSGSIEGPIIIGQANDITIGNQPQKKIND